MATESAPPACAHRDPICGDCLSEYERGEIVRDHPPAVLRANGACEVCGRPAGEHAAPVYGETA